MGNRDSMDPQEPPAGGRQTQGTRRVHGPITALKKIQRKVQKRAQPAQQPKANGPSILRYCRGTTKALIQVFRRLHDLAATPVQGELVSAQHTVNSYTSHMNR